MRSFDRVNHDMLMVRVAREVKDKRVLKLIGRYLRSGIMVEGVVMERTEGTPQGSPLSPLLANLYLDPLDQELEQRGHAFARYADDCNVYVGGPADRDLVAVDREASAAEGEPEQERGGAALGAEVSGIPNHPRRPDRSFPGKPRALQATGP